MFYIELTPQYGRYGHQITSIPYGATQAAFALCPEEMVPVFIAADGFVSITVQDGVVVYIEENAEARAAWEARPQPEPEPTTEEISLDLLADHEYRLCMTELGLS